MSSTPVPQQQPDPRPALLPAILCIALLLGLPLALAPGNLPAPGPINRAIGVPKPAPTDTDLIYAPSRLLALFGQGFDTRMAWQRWVVSAWQPSQEAASVISAPRETAEAELLGVGEDSLRQLLGLEVRTIVIDPGHGGRDPGAVGPTGLFEKDINLAVALDLRKRLSRQPDLYVLMTREEDISLSLRDRVSFANLQAADLFISIHVNSLAQESRPFIETFYPGTDDASAISHEQLALENRYSGYSIGEFRQLLDGLGNRFRHDESRRLAGSIQQKLFANMRRHNPDLLSGGLKNAPLVVLLGTSMPAVLVEISSLSNRAEEARLATLDYRRLIVNYLEQGILAYLSDIRVDTRVEKEGAAQYASQENPSSGH